MFGVPFGTAVDLWSLGCILAEFFKGEPIFYGQNREEILEKVKLHTLDFRWDKTGQLRLHRQSTKWHLINNFLKFYSKSFEIAQVDFNLLQLITQIH